jgi:TrpR-related protein YerC/YecD
MIDNRYNNINALCKAFLLLETEKEVFNFLKDLCTPDELNSMVERWQICKLLDKGLSYRQIHIEIGSSLTTIGRVARFLRDEPYQGYSNLLQKLKDKKRG